MAASKLLFINQPSAAVQGQKITGSASTRVGDVAYIPTPASLLVGVYDANNVLQTADTSSVTIAIGTNPTSGSTLSGTLTRPVISGYATFDDLAISLGGTGYTLTATDGGLTSATTNTFNVTNVSRVNNAEFVSTALVGTGAANAQGPYRFRAGSSLKGVEISASSSNTTDAVQIVITEPGQALGANTAAKPTTIQGGSAFQLGPLTCPFHITMDSNEMGGACDIYVYATTNTGSIIVNIKRMETGGRS